jgi:hypothetical protein
MAEEADADVCGAIYCKSIVKKTRRGKVNLGYPYTFGLGIFA